MTRLSNHPDFVGITLVLIDKLNPKVFLNDCRNTYVLKITNNLSSIPERNCRLRTLEMAFSSLKISKFSGVASPPNSLEDRAFGARTFSRFFTLIWLDSLDDVIEMS